MINLPFDFISVGWKIEVMRRDYFYYKDKKIYFNIL